MTKESLADSMLKGSDEAEPASVDADETAVDESDEDADGKAAITAVKHGDAAAFAEAVKRICGHY